MIKGICKSQIKDFDATQWPDLFAQVPLLGAGVMNKKGDIMVVVNVIHTMTAVHHTLGGESKDGFRPMILVELDKI